MIFPSHISHLPFHHFPHLITNGSIIYFTCLSEQSWKLTLVERLRGSNRLSTMVEWLKITQPKYEHRFQQRNRNRMTMKK
ncbi:MAG: hypothetical protein AB1546_13070 [bacterium]